MDYEKQIQNDADEIINGKGYVVIPNLFSKKEIKEAKDLIYQNMDNQHEEVEIYLQDLLFLLQTIQAQHCFLIFF